jgi:hypothetical protein
MQNSKKAAGQIRIEANILRRSVANDPEAINIMFSQFIPTNEQIHFAEFLGVEGLWGIGRKSFACITDRRLASLRVGAFKEVVYQDGFLEHTNSGFVYQPSKLGLYILIFFATLLGLGLSGAVFALAIAAYNPAGAGGLVGANTVFPLVLGFAFMCLILPALWLIAVRTFYRFVKCGMVWCIREGISVYVFASRKRLTRINQLYRMLTELRDTRLMHIRERL